jgi:proline dehydrogenase
MKEMGLLHSDEGLRQGDLEELGVLWGKLRSLGQIAQDNGYVLFMRIGEILIRRVKLMIDAEHTWYQPALDAFTLLLSEEFNRPPKDVSNWKGPLILYVPSLSEVIAKLIL